MMRIVPASGGELGLSVHGVECTPTLRSRHCIVRYNGCVTVAGFRFNVSINFGDNTNGIWRPDRVWVLATPDRSDPSVKEALQRATDQALKAGFASARRDQNNCFECPVCRRNRGHADGLKSALLLPKSADLSTYATMRVASRTSRDGTPTDLYNLCLIHGHQIFHTQNTD